MKRQKNVTWYVRKVHVFFALLCPHFLLTTSLPCFVESSCSDEDYLVPLVTLWLQSGVQHAAAGFMDTMSLFAWYDGGVGVMTCPYLSNMHTTEV
jgi:hypothetical protein